MDSFEIIDVFETEDERRLGLQYRTIAEDDCALFIYDAPCYPSFWNVNVPTDLHVSAVWNGKIVDAFVMSAGSVEPYKFTKQTDLVIESRCELPVGSYVEISESGRLYLC